MYINNGNYLFSYVEQYKNIYLFAHHRTLNINESVI